LTLKLDYRITCRTRIPTFGFIAGYGIGGFGGVMFIV